MDHQEEFLARAAAGGMTTSDALMLADLVKHAVKRANEAVDAVADTAPNHSMRLLVKINALNSIQLLTLRSLLESGPLGRAFAEKLHRENAPLLAEMFGEDAP